MIRPALLDGDTVDVWLHAHHDWFLRDAHLVREVRLDDGTARDALLLAQAELAATLDHHALIEVAAPVVSFELWTHDRGGITHLDLDFAEGLDDLIRERFAGT